jgi:hypothetical protein
MPVAIAVRHSDTFLKKYKKQLIVVNAASGWNGLR